MAETEVYLFTGPEAGEKNEAIENLRDAASKKNNGIEQYKYYAADVRIEDIVAQLQNASLFSHFVGMDKKKLPAGERFINF